MPNKNNDNNDAANNSSAKASSANKGTPNYTPQESAEGDPSPKFEDMTKQIEKAN